MAFTNYTSAHPSISYLNKSSEVHDGLKSNLVLLTALLTYVKTSLIRDSYEKQLILSQAHYRVSQAISLVSEIDYPIALELAESSDLVGTALTGREYGLIHEVVRRGDSRPPVTDGVLTNVTLVTSRVCKVIDPYGATVVSFLYGVLMFIFLLCVINLIRSHFHVSRRNAAFAAQARSDNKWAEDLEKHAREWNVRITKMTGKHEQISELLQEYQRFFKESSDKLNSIDCTVIQSYDQSTPEDERLKTINVLIAMIKKLAENQNSIRGKLIELYEALPRIGKFGSHLADLVVEVIPELGRDEQAGSEGSVESVYADVSPLPIAFEKVEKTSFPQSENFFGRTDDAAEGKEWWKEEHSMRQLASQTPNPALQPPVTPLLKSFDCSEFHDLHNPERAAQQSLHMRQIRMAELFEVVGRKRKVLDLCGRAIWEGVVESSTVVLKPLELTATSIKFIRECHRMFTTDQDTQCPCKHIADTVCNQCLRRVLCAYHCTICELALRMVAGWYDCNLSSPKAMHDVIYYLLVFQGKAPARRKALYPYERPVIPGAETVASRSRMYDPIEEVTSNFSLTEYNLYRSCSVCQYKYPTLGDKKEAERCQDLSYSTWFIRHFSKETEGKESGWNTEFQKCFEPADVTPNNSGNCPRCNERGPSAAYNLATCSVTITPAPFTDQTDNLDEELEEILKELDLPETVSLIKPSHGTLIAREARATLEALELPEVAKSRMILRGKLESIIGAVLNTWDKGD